MSQQILRIGKIFPDSQYFKDVIFEPAGFTVPSFDFGPFFLKFYHLNNRPFIEGEVKGGIIRWFKFHINGC